MILLGVELVNNGATDVSILSLLAPSFALVLPWVAGAMFSMNPFGEEGAVLPVTLLTAAGYRYVRGLMIPAFVFGLPAVVVLTAIAAAAAPYALPAKVALVVLAAFLTCVAGATAPAVGMRFPRFSSIRLGQSREVLPPRLSTTYLHLLSIALPGGLLALFTVAPATGRGVVAFGLGTVPTVLLSLIGENAPLSLRGVETAFSGFGNLIRATPTTTLQLGIGGLLVAGGVVLAIASYRSAVRRFETFSP